MERNAVVWTLVAFFGATVVFAAIRREFEGQSVLLSLGLQAAVAVAFVVVAALIMRRRG